MDQVSYHEYDGPGTLEEREAVGASCGQSNCIIMRNHGLLTLGETIPRAFRSMYYLELSCQIQASANAMNEPLLLINADIQAKTTALEQSRRDADQFAMLEWEALLRMLDRQGSDHRN